MLRLPSTRTTTFRRSRVSPAATTNGRARRTSAVRRARPRKATRTARRPRDGRSRLSARAQNTRATTRTGRPTYRTGASSTPTRDDIVTEAAEGRGADHAPARLRSRFLRELAVVLLDALAI